MSTTRATKKAKRTAGTRPVTPRGPCARGLRALPIFSRETSESYRTIEVTHRARVLASVLVPPGAIPADVALLARYSAARTIGAWYGDLAVRWA